MKLKHTQTHTHTRIKKKKHLFIELLPDTNPSSNHSNKKPKKKEEKYYTPIFNQQATNQSTFSIEQVINIRVPTQIRPHPHATKQKTNK